ncbi:MAG: GTP-binding protein [Planctomycetes bacterium]|nr:GTP-binding protein [Planctomycetota bacterium]
MQHIPVTVLTGFLGSGKTTLLRRLLEDPAFTDTALIVNEFGEVAIDHLLVADLAENIVELRDGCLCCTIRGDLVMTLRDLWQRRCLEEVPPFARVVVETTGLADPIPLLHTLMANAPLMKVYRLDAVVCVLDAQHGAATLAAHDTALRQLALADLVVLSKTDLVDAPAREAIVARLREVNPRAELVTAVQGDVEPAAILDRGLFQPAPRAADVRAWWGDGERACEEPGHADHAVHDHGAEYMTHVIRHPAPLSMAGTAVFLNRVVNLFADDILRIKGIAAFRDKGSGPAVLHAVQSKFYPVSWLEDWPDTDHDSRLVFIGRHLDTARIDELFAALCV